MVKNAGKGRIMKKIAAFLLTAFLLVSACSAPQTETKTTSPAETQPRLTVEETAAEPTPTEETGTEEDGTRTVSALAREWFMEPAENYSWEREEKPEFIVLHFSSNAVADPEHPCDVEAIRKIFLETEVSANYIVDRDGTVYCLIPEDRCAWHAGVGTWRGEERLTNKMNRYSFGIEMVAVGSQKDMAQYLTPAEYARIPADCIGFTEAQYQAVRALVEDLCRRYSLYRDSEHIIGHQEYSPSKNDPGELFDWMKVI